MFLRKVSWSNEDKFILVSLEVGSYWGLLSLIVHLSSYACLLTVMSHMIEQDVIFRNKILFKFNFGA